MNNCLQKQGFGKNFIIFLCCFKFSTIVLIYFTNRLEHEKERIERAKLGQILNSELYSYDRILDRMIDVWQAYLNGERGMIHPHEFKLNLLTGI